MELFPVEGHGHIALDEGKPQSKARQSQAITKFAAFHGRTPSSVTIQEVVKSSAGIDVWADSDPQALHKVDGQIYSSALCGLWIRQALMAANELPEWERIVLTVDSGASETVVPPHIARNLPLLPSPKVGTEYEVANGGVVVNLGQRDGEIKLAENAKASFLMSFQVVEVHKPLLAVSRLVEAGHRVIFDKSDPHIMLNNGERMPMQCRGGTYEIEIWIKNPGFTRPHNR